LPSSENSRKLQKLSRIVILSFNLKVAEQIGLTIPLNALAQADQVIK
jgi:hypothetical protein